MHKFMKTFAALIVIYLGSLSLGQQSVTQNNVSFTVGYSQVITSYYTAYTAWGYTPVLVETQPHINIYDFYKGGKVVRITFLDNNTATVVEFSWR